MLNQLIIFNPINIRRLAKYYFFLIKINNDLTQINEKEN